MPKKETLSQDSSNAILRCSANFKHKGSDEAVSLLLVSVRDKGCLVAYPRCAEHPAETYLRLVGLIHPGELSCVVPLIKSSDLAKLVEEV